MKVHVRLHGFRELGKERTEELEEGATGADLMEQLGISPEAALLFRGDDPIPTDAALEAGEELRILRITSGG